MGIDKSRIEQAVDLLVDEIVERVAARDRPPSAPGEPGTSARIDSGTAPGEGTVDGAEPPEAASQGAPLSEAPPSHTASMLRRMAVWMLAAIVLINVPLNRFGITLATAMPDTASLVIRDGLVVKEENDQDIYVYRNGQFRWISSLEAFDHYGYTWDDVHIVADGYLERYEIGAPLHVLLKCDASPHIYRLEGGVKRWIRDIDAFVAAGHVWDDVRTVSCATLRGLPDGETIPPGAGPPPQP
jgi:hypothetical protein